MTIDNTSRDKKFFYAAELNAGMFDGTIDLVVPFYQTMHDTMSRLLEMSFGGPASSSHEPTVILEVGSGTGGESLRFLKQFRDLKVVAIDFSKPMNDVFRRSFSREFPAVDIHSRVRFVEGDALDNDGRPEHLLQVLADFTDGKKKAFDAVVSALTIHHLDRRDKFEIYGRAFEVLRSGGALVNGDLFSYESRQLTNAAKEFDMEWIKDHFKGGPGGSATARADGTPIAESDYPRLSAQWQKHYEEDNLLDSVEIQEQMLRFVGFRKTGVPFRYWQVGILWACK